MATHNATIERKETVTTLILVINGEELNIVLTEDNPNEVKTVFNRLLTHLKDDKIEFNLTDDKEDLYFHICKEYITQLNAELESTYTELEDNGLLSDLM